MRSPTLTTWAHSSAPSIAFLAWAIGCSGGVANPTGANLGAGGQAGSSAGGGGAATTGSTAGAGVGGDNGSGGTSGSSGTGGDAGAAGTGSGSGTIVTGPECSTDATAGTDPDFGSNVVVFDPSMGVPAIQSQISAVYNAQGTTQFSSNRKALLFKAGQYGGLNVDIGYYMQALGLGQAPDDVAVTGEVRSIGSIGTNNVTLSFWRAAENMSVTPTGGIDRWAVSQGTQFRRMHVKGAMALSIGGFASGGFIADSKVDGYIASGSQQQWFTRNTNMGSWNGGTWNMTFVGCSNTPAGAWPTSPFTVVGTVPLVREKPHLFLNPAGRYCVRVPALKTSSSGITWATGPGDGPSMNMDQFYVTAPTDTAATINAALGSGKNLLITPGVYHLSGPLEVARAGTVVLGLGMTTLLPDNGTPAMVVADVDGVKIAGLMLDAGPQSSPTLLQLGNPGDSKDHSLDPTVIHDLVCRIGGGSAGTAASCVIVNSNDVIGDQFWLWRADHGAGAGWTSNASKNGIIVNGNNVTMYGLFAEHFQEYQVLWNGNGGKTYFYQSEMPYDPPSQSGWMNGTVNGFASYKVADNVTTHEAWGLGIYTAFRNAVFSENAVETPSAAGVVMHHIVAQWLNGMGGITHVINGTGGAAVNGSPHQTTPN